MATEERVLCFKRQLLEELGMFQGLSLEVEKYLPVVTARANLVYLNRSEAEHDRRYKQLIPYVLVIFNNHILRYRRGRGGEETRLHGLYSVGIGGHISDEDHGLFSDGAGYQDGMRRELREEVAVDEGNEVSVAVINDDSTEVGYVHFGVVHLMHVASERIAGRRSGIVGPEFIPIAEAVKDASSYESWSRFCLEHLEVLLSKERNNHRWTGMNTDFTEGNEGNEEPQTSRKMEATRPYRKDAERKRRDGRKGGES